MEVKKYIQENEERFLSELESLIRIPSISAKAEHKADIAACAERWKELLLEAGVDRAEVMPSNGFSAMAEASMPSFAILAASMTRCPEPLDRLRLSTGYTPPTSSAARQALW